MWSLLSVSYMQIFCKTVKCHQNWLSKKIVVIKSRFNNDAFMADIVIFYVKGGMLWFCDLGYIYICHWTLFCIYYKYVLFYGFWIYWPVIIKNIWLLKKISAVKLIKKVFFYIRTKKLKTLVFSLLYFLKSDIFSFLKLWNINALFD